MTTTGQPMTHHKAGFFETIKSIAWAFFGVRGRKGHERDLARLHPLHVILAGLLMAAVFVLALIVIVRVVAA
jgi:hypothetical protein